MTQFAKGQKVRWTSQSGGRRTAKEGTIVCVVPAGKSPSEHRNASATYAKLRALGVDGFRFNISRLGGGFGRQEESYLVAVPTPSGRGQPKLYWPRVVLLEPAADRADG